VGAQSLLGELEGSLGVLQAAGLEEFDDSLFVSGDACDLVDDLSNQFSSLADFGLGRDWSCSLGLEFGCLMSLVFAKGNVGGLAFGH